METLEKETKGLEDWVRGVMVEDWAVCGVRGVSEECKFSMQCAIRSRIVKHTTVHEVPQGSTYVRMYRVHVQYSSWVVHRVHRRSLVHYITPLHLEALMYMHDVVV